MQNIPEWGQKIKVWLEDGVADWGLTIIVFLVAFAAFGLGRLSAFESPQMPVSTGQAPSESKPQGIYRGGLIVASRTGKSYYFPWCPNATKLTAANQVWFQSEAEAQRAGYKPGKACRGLDAQ